MMISKCSWNDVLFVIVVEDPPRPIPQLLYVVLPTPTICSQIEETSVGVPFLNVGNSSALRLPCFLDH